MSPVSLKGLPDLSPNLTKVNIFKMYMSSISYLSF